MKKLTILLSAMIMASFVAMPVMALDVKFSGNYNVEGVSNSNPRLNDNDSTYNYFNMKLRVKTDFVLNENLKLTTRFDALDRMWGTRDDNNAPSLLLPDSTDSSNIDFDWAYITAITKIGLIKAGRMEGDTWGTKWADDGDPRNGESGVVDRLSYLVPLPMGDDKLYLAAEYEKAYEFTTVFNDSSSDDDRYYLAAVYKSKEIETGLLAGFYDYETFRDTDQAAGVASADRGISCSASVYLLSPYYEGKFGDIGVNTELLYIFGKSEYQTAPDYDVDAYSFWLEGTYDYNQFMFQAGFATVSGDADPSDDKLSAMAYVEPGIDWKKTFILSSDDCGMQTSLGNGVGNHVGSGIGTTNPGALDGFLMLYLGADYALNDEVTFGAIAAISQADDVPDDTATQKWEKDQGVEVDLTFKYKIMNNLEYTAIAAYLAAGDYWAYRGTNGQKDPDAEDTYSLYHKLELTF